MASEVEICNGALQKLGAVRIASLTADSRNARACNAGYSRIRDRELRRHTWNFAVKRAQLAASSTAPLFGRDRAFPLPSDFIRLLPLDPEDNLNTLDWQIEGRSIITDDSAPLNIRYVAQITDPNTMDALFRDCLSTAIAVEICEEITQSSSKKESLKDDYKRILSEARLTNAVESVSAEPPEDTWVTVRA